MNIVEQLKVGDTVKIRKHPAPIEGEVLFIHSLKLFVSIKSKNYPEAIWPEDILSIVKI